MLRRLKIIVLVLTTLSLEACVPSRADVPRTKPAPGIRVEVVEVGEGGLTEQGRFSGRLEPAINLSVSADIAGRIAMVAVREGDVVNKGDLLLTIDPKPYELARDQAVRNLEQARLRVEQLQQSLEVERGQLDASVAQAQAAVDSAAARVRLVENGARPEEIKQLKANQDAAHASLENAEAELKRVVQLLEDQAATPQQLDMARTTKLAAEAQYEVTRQAYRLAIKGARQEDRDTARAGLAQAGAGLDQARAGLTSLAVRDKDLESARIQVKMAELSLENAEYNLTKTRIYSPIEGEAVVILRTVEPGEYLNPGVQVLKLADLSKPHVDTAVPAVDLAGLSMDQQVSVHCIGDPRGERTGRVTMIGAQADRTNTTFPVQVTLENRDRGLRGGQVCRVTADLGLHQGLVVPSDAILDSEIGKVAVLVKEDRARIVKVEVAAQRDARVLVTRGLTSGDLVVVVGQRLVKDGDLVKIVEPEAGAEAGDKEEKR